MKQATWQYLVEFYSIIGLILFCQDQILNHLVQHMSMRLGVSMAPPFFQLHLVLIVISVMFCPASGLLQQLLFYSKGPGHLAYPQNNFFPGGNPTEWHSSMSQPFMFPSISSIFFSARSIWLWLFLSCFVLVLGWLGGCGSYFFIRRVSDTSHTPRIISSLGKSSYRMAFNMALSWKWRQHVPTFHVSLYFFHLLFSKKHLVVIVIVMFCPVSVLVGWLCSYFFIRRVPDISHTPKIISHLGKSHRMAFNLALSWTRGSTMS